MIATSGPDVSVIIVSYNTREVLRDCLTAVEGSSQVTLELFVVDNHSRDGSADMVAQDFPCVHLIRNADNRGFAAANNLAIPRTSGRFVLLLNPDTVVRPETIGTLARYLAANPGVGICGPRVMNPDGSQQSCGYQYPTPISEIRQSKNIPGFLRRIVGPEPPRRPRMVPTEVEWVDGCCLMIRRDVIDMIGLLDEQFFMYAEELDWCFNARRRGWRIVAHPGTSILHYGGQSSVQVAERSLALLIETRLRYYRKNVGLGTAGLVSLVYLAGLAKQYRADRVKSQAKLRGIWQWMRSRA
ncbi:MAG: glycosyltransferase family 2 protein [Vicinamibacterales bacterium]